MCPEEPPGEKYRVIPENENFNGLRRRRKGESMIIRKHGEHTPQVASTARLAENVTLVGQVTVGEEASLWYGSVVRGDEGAIVIGDGTNIQDGSVVHGRPVRLGRGVTVGHGAIIHGCTVEDDCLIGMGAILLNGCRIGEGSIIGAGALVPEGKEIPPRSLAVGVPARVVRSLTDEEVSQNRANAVHYVEAGKKQLPSWEECLEKAEK